MGVKGRISKPPEEEDSPGLETEEDDSTMTKRYRLALEYLATVRSELEDQPDVYNQFLEIMQEFRDQSMVALDVIKSVARLFRGHFSLILGFNAFLPDDHMINEADIRRWEAEFLHTEQPAATIGVTAGSYAVDPASVSQADDDADAVTSAVSVPSRSTPATGASTGQQHNILLDPPPERMSDRPRRSRRVPAAAAATAPGGDPMAKDAGARPLNGRPRRAVRSCRGGDGDGGDGGGLRERGEGGEGEGRTRRTVRYGGGGGGDEGGAGGGRTDWLEGDGRDEGEGEDSNVPGQRTDAQYSKALVYLEKVRKYFKDELRQPELFHQFKHIIHTKKKDEEPKERKRRALQLWDKAQNLLGDQWDLLEEFTKFLPDIVKGQVEATLRRRETQAVFREHG
ncbi:unnamed protein product, partial [Discosporangium mesarthrocarpum]